MDTLAHLATVERLKEMNPVRTLWTNTPDVVIHAGESAVKKHPEYAAAKGGNIPAAGRLVRELVTDDTIKRIRRLVGDEEPLIAAVHAAESESTNVIPVALAVRLARELNLPLDRGIVQINRVSHTGSSGYHRLSTPPLFAGDVTKGRAYLLVDDFVGQGGTLANLRGYIEDHGGRVIGATVLTGKSYSARLQLTQSTLKRLRKKHGKALENWWQQEFGFGLDRLTESEARYLERSNDVDTIRDRILEAKQGAGH